MRILLFGASGQLGSDIRKRVGTRGEVVGHSWPEIDIADSTKVTELTDTVNPDVIINAAAYTDVDGAESDSASAFRVNEQGARNIAIAARKAGAYFIHTSTDYVFNGRNNRPWREDDPVDPLGVYGRSKLAGEIAVLEELPSSVIVRTAWLHGSSGKNFLQTMLRLFREREEVRVVEDQIGNPTWSGWLADVLLDIAPKKPSGILHATCAGDVSWFGFAEEIWKCSKAKLIDAKLQRLLPQSSAVLNRPAPRPNYSSLDCSRLHGILGRPSMGWEEGVRAHLKELGLLG